MERLVQGPIKLNSSLHVEHLGVYSLGDIGYVNNNAESLDDYNMPFLQMLQSPPLFLSNFQHLKKEKPCHNTEGAEMGETQIQGLEVESCVTLDVTEMNKEAVQKQKQKQKVSKYCAPPANRKKRKRKRPRQRQKKNKEEAESQRMTHIAVERNRRRQMNDHLTALRSLMPTSYIQRGHQASIIGGAIDFVTDLERVLNSLEARKRTRLAEEYGDGWSEVTVVEERVNLKVQCRRRSGQLMRAIVALEEELRLTVMHLDISSGSPSLEEEDTVLYSFNLKIESDCGVGSVEQIEAAVQQIFSITSNLIDD